MAASARKQSSAVTDRASLSSKDLARATGQSDQQSEDFRVLVTGFGVFTSAPTSNPAWEIARQMPREISSNHDRSVKIKLTIHPEPIKVAYDAIDHLVDEVYGQHLQQYHLILHIGVASSKRTFYSAERVAYRDGYSEKDVDGHLPGETSRPDYWSKAPHVLQTIAFLEDVLPQWTNEQPELDLRISDDAGRYLCEYVFFSSLARLTWDGNNERPRAEQTQVEFLHVPNKEEPEHIETGVKAAVGLIVALIDTWHFKKGGQGATP